MHTSNEDKYVYGENDGARKMTVQGWVDRHGRFYGDNEKSARWGSCTHKRCDCGRLMERHWTKCDDCRDKLSKDKFYALPAEPWDGESMIYSDRNDDYYSDLFEAEDAANDSEVSMEEMKLMHTEKVSPPCVEEDYYCDMSDGEDGHLPSCIAELCDEFNEKVKKLFTEQPIYMMVNKRIKLEN